MILLQDVLSDVVFGLDVNLTIAFLVVSVLILLWGFDRYRTTFSKREFGITILLSFGVLALGVFPNVFVIIAELLNVSETFRAVQITANVAFVFLLLYAVSMINDNRRAIGDLTRGLTIQQSSIVDNPAEETIYIVIPAYNEAETVSDVLESLPVTLEGYTIRPVVVSDGSEDRTAEVAGQYDDAVVVEHPINQGQGSALRTGFDIAQRNGADIVITMDADGQHPADQLNKLIAPIIHDEADYVIGSRYRGEDESGNSLTRRGGIRTFTWLINRMAKTDISDCTNGFRAIRGTRLPELTLTEERFSAPELIIESRKNGLRIAEVPVTIREREAGETKKPGMGYAVGLARTILSTWIR